MWLPNICIISAVKANFNGQHVACYTYLQAFPYAACVLHYKQIKFNMKAHKTIAMTLHISQGTEGVVMLTQHQDHQAENPVN